MTETARRFRWLPAVTAVYVTSLIISNIIAVKLITVCSLVLSASVVLFPVSYIFGDVLTEIYGYSKARQVIWTGFACNLMTVAAIYASINLTAAPFWTVGALDASASQKAYEAVLGFTPRLLVASFMSVLSGEFVNSFVMAKMKIISHGRHLWMRTIGSTLAGQLVDTIIFITIAFFGLITTDKLLLLILTQWLVKSAYETLATPLTYMIVNYLKRVENEDHYDHKTNFNPFVLKEG